MVKKNPAIIQMEDLTESINLLVYSDPGAGKTVFAASGSNSLILRLDKGTVSAKRQGSTADVWPCPDWTEVQKAYRWLRDNPDHGYTWIVIDSVTKFQQFILRDILRIVVEENSKRDEDIPAIQDHQKWQNQFKRCVDEFIELPCNTLWTATVMRREDSEGEEVVLPDIHGKDYQIAQYVTAAMDIVGYLKVTAPKGTQPEKREILFKATPPHVAKDRYDCMGRWWPLTSGDKQLNTLDTLKARIDASGPKREVSEKPSAARKVTPPTKRAPRRAPVRK